MNIPLLLLSAAFAVRLKRMATHISKTVYGMGYQWTGGEKRNETE